jgi:ribosomal protein L40E
VPIPGRVWRVVSFVLVALAGFATIAYAYFQGSRESVPGVLLVAVLQPLAWLSIVFAVVADRRFQSYIACPACGKLVPLKATKCAYCTDAIDARAVREHQPLEQTKAATLIACVYVICALVAASLVASGTTARPAASAKPSNTGPASAPKPAPVSAEESKRICYDNHVKLTEAAASPDSPAWAALAASTVCPGGGQYSYRADGVYCSFHEPTEGFWEYWY